MSLLCPCLGEISKEKTDEGLKTREKRDDAGVGVSHIYEIYEIHNEATPSASYYILRCCMPIFTHFRTWPVCFATGRQQFKPVRVPMHASDTWVLF